MLTNTAIPSTIRDRNPDIVAAGKLFGSGDKTEDCIQLPEKPNAPEQVQKFRATTQSAPGKTRIFYGRYSDPNVALTFTHGVSTKSSDMASQLISPQPRSYFHHNINQKREASVYASHQRAPLGRSHDQSPGLPEGGHDQRFGLPIAHDRDAGELLNPHKSRAQVEEEGQQGQELYKKSHNAYTVGETYDRKYDWTRIPDSTLFGIETPHDNRGSNTKKSLKWLTETLNEKSVQFTSKRVDNFRQRNTPQVGKVHDPIKDTLNVGPDHTFGIMLEPDDYGADDLIHMRQTTAFLRGRDRIRGVLAAVRQHLKKANYHNFTDLKAAFSFYDKNKSGTIDLDELRDICYQFHLPVQKDLLELLIEWCDKDQNKTIDYVEFANFLNWKDKMPSGLDLSRPANDGDKEKKDLSEDEKYEERIRNAVKKGLIDSDKGSPVVDVLTIDNQPEAGDYTTSYSLLNGAVRQNFAKTQRPYGIPTIRSDLPAPRIRRMGDNANYGDESDAFGLINPSVYSNIGVFEEDFFTSRDQNAIKRIFTNIGVDMSHDEFQKIWSEAQNISKNGHVSVESFRNILDEKMAEGYESYKSSENRPKEMTEKIREMIINKPKIYEKFRKKETNPIA